MPFKKKFYSGIDGAGTVVHQIVSVDTESIVNGALVSTSIQKRIDISKDFPAFPDIDTFNDLESQIRAGVNLQRVNTKVLSESDVAEVNRDLSDLVDADPLKKEDSNV